MYIHYTEEQFSRVCEVVLHGDKTFSLAQQKYRVSDAVKTGEATALFSMYPFPPSYLLRLSFPFIDYLADSVDAFLTTRASSGLDSETSDENSQTTTQNAKNPVPLGFTFSFPVDQTAIDSGKLLTWTKGFNVKNVVGHDVVKLLQDAFDRKRMNVKCVALVNDVRLHFFHSIFMFMFISFSLDGGHAFIQVIHCRRLCIWLHLRYRD